jgi:hypothetical protein
MEQIRQGGKITFFIEQTIKSQSAKPNRAQIDKSGIHRIGLEGSYD